MPPGRRAARAAARSDGDHHQASRPRRLRTVGLRHASASSAPPTGLRAARRVRARRPARPARITLPLCWARSPASKRSPANRSDSLTARESRYTLAYLASFPDHAAPAAGAACGHCSPTRAPTAARGLRRPRPRPRPRPQRRRPRAGGDAIVPAAERAVAPAGPAGPPGGARGAVREGGSSGQPGHPRAEDPRGLAQAAPGAPRRPGRRRRGPDQGAPWRGHRSPDEVRRRDASRGARDARGARAPR